MKLRCYLRVENRLLFSVGMIIFCTASWAVPTKGKADHLLSSVLEGTQGAGGDSTPEAKATPKDPKSEAKQALKTALAKAEDISVLRLLSEFSQSDEMTADRLEDALKEWTEDSRKAFLLAYDAFKTQFSKDSQKEAALLLMEETKGRLIAKPKAGLMKQLEEWKEKLKAVAGAKPPEEKSKQEREAEVLADRMEDLLRAYRRERDRNDERDAWYANQYDPVYDRRLEDSADRASDDDEHDRPTRSASVSQPAERPRYYPDRFPAERTTSDSEKDEKKKSFNLDSLLKDSTAESEEAEQEAPEKKAEAPTPSIPESTPEVGPAPERATTQLALIPSDSRSSVGQEVAAAASSSAGGSAPLGASASPTSSSASNFFNSIVLDGADPMPPAMASIRYAMGSLGFGVAIGAAGGSDEVQETVAFEIKKKIGVAVPDAGAVAATPQSQVPSAEPGIFGVKQEAMKGLCDSDSEFEVGICTSLKKLESEEFAAIDLTGM